VAVVMSLPEGQDRNVASVHRVDDLAEALYLAEGITAIATLVKKNWLIRRRDEPSGKFSFTIPGKRKG